MEVNTMSNLLFILGYHKTGTSSLVGILNCHPQIYIMYEVSMFQPIVSKYGNQFLSRYPETRRLFGYSPDIKMPYIRLCEWFSENIQPYTFVGDKLLCLDEQKMESLATCRVIYTVRDIRTWLCKEAIQTHYRTDLDIIPAAIDYIHSLINSFRYDTWTRVTTEQLIFRNDELVEQLSAFLGCNLATYTDHWWEGLDSWDKANPKYAIRWFTAHPSSHLKPAQMDTQVLLAQNIAWDELLPIFDKYYNNPCGKFSSVQLDADIQKIQRVARLSPVPLRDAYQEVHTTGFVIEQGRSKSTTTPIKSPIKYLRYLIRGGLRWLANRL